MATLPSPTKKQYNLPSIVVPTPESSTSERGSFTQAASTEWTDLIKTRARDTRFAVNKGFSRAPSSDLTSIQAGRQLGPTQSAPNLSFFGRPSAPIFQSAQETLSSVYGVANSNSTGKRWDELRPFINSGSANGSDGGDSMFSKGFSRSSSMVDNNSGNGDGDGGDGFDMEEVYPDRVLGGFGAIPSYGFNSRTSSFGIPPIEESQETNSSTQTVTKQLKRAFEPEDEDGFGGEDFDMDEGGGDTDVDEEDLIEEQERLDVFSRPIGRPVSGRRSLAKTQSLPASAFTGTMF